MISRDKGQDRQKMQKTIVTITPVAVARDSRTFKQANFMAYFGYKSIIVEGQKSDLKQETLPFELYSLNNRKTGIDKFSRQSPRNPGHHEKIHSSIIGRLKNSQIWNLLYFFLYDRLYQYILCTLLKTPKAQLYYLHAYYQFPIIYLLSKIYRVPYIYDAHDFYSGIREKSDLNWSQKYIMLPFDYWLETNCIKNATAVVTVNNGISDLIHSEFGRRGTVIRNCQDSRFNEEPEEGLRDILNLNDKDYLLVAVGQAKPSRAIKEAIDALTQLPDEVHIAFVGRNFEQFINQIMRLKLETRMHMIPPVKPFEVSLFIKSADVALILYYPLSINDNYSLPNSFFQSIDAGLPILYPNDLPEIRKIAEQYQIGLPINPRSPASIRDAVMKIIHAPEQLSIYRKNVLRASQELNWEHEEKIQEDLINQVLYPVSFKEVLT